MLDDDWTVVTADGSWAAHAEHTFALTDRGPWVLTALDGGEEALTALGVPFGGLLSRWTVRTGTRVTTAAAGGEYSFAAGSSARAPTRDSGSLRPAGRPGRAGRWKRPSAVPRPLAQESHAVDVPTWLWWTTIVVTVGFLLVDVLVIGRRPHEPSTREVSRDLVFYIGAAVLFGIGVWYFAGAQYGGEFFAGWLTEYSLSIDNLFIFIIIMTKLQVPRQYQQTALLIGIVHRAGHARHLHRRRRGRDQPVQLGLLPLRRSS